MPYGLLIVFRSKLTQIWIKSEDSMIGFGHLMVFSRALLMTKTAKRRCGERPSGGLCFLLREIVVHCSIALFAHSNLAGIIAQLEPLSRQHGIVKFFKNVDHANTLNGFVQDLTNAVTDYQVRNPDSIVGVF